MARPQLYKPPCIIQMRLNFCARVHFQVVRSRRKPGEPGVDYIERAYSRLGIVISVVGDTKNNVSLLPAINTGGKARGGKKLAGNGERTAAWTNIDNTEARSYRSFLVNATLTGHRLFS